jgi:hypothetical protein
MSTLLSQKGRYQDARGSMVFLEPDTAAGAEWNILNWLGVCSGVSR